MIIFNHSLTRLSVNGTSGEHKKWVHLEDMEDTLKEDNLENFIRIKANMFNTDWQDENILKAGRKHKTMFLNWLRPKPLLNKIKLSVRVRGKIIPLLINSSYVVSCQKKLQLWSELVTFQIRYLKATAL